MLGRNDRFKGLPWYQLASESQVLVGGAGGIGSWLCLLLTRAGFPTTVLDFDIIEPHNLGGQLFGNTNLSSHKVIALKEVAAYLSDHNLLNPMVKKVDSNTFTSPIVITAFDNIKARKDMYLKWKSVYIENPVVGDVNAIFIDPRLEAEQLFIYTIRGDDYERMKEYEEKHLPDDDTIQDAECTAKQTSHVAAIIAGLIVSILTNHITNVSTGFEERFIPFKFKLFTPLMLIQNEF